jgi:hypothetical protein
MNMAEMGYIYAGMLIAMVVGVHGNRILQRLRDNRLNDGRADIAPAVGYN